MLWVVDVLMLVLGMLILMCMSLVVMVLTRLVLLVLRILLVGPSSIPTRLGDHRYNTQAQSIIYWACVLYYSQW